jgi:hypothetical protein
MLPQILCRIWVLLALRAGVDLRWGGQQLRV